MKREDLPIAILGAGLAGLICARQLNRAGSKCVLFDMGNAVGKRLGTRRHPDNHFLQFDCGAQYFTANSTRFQGEVKDWVKSGVVAPWSPQLMRFSQSQWSHPEQKMAFFVGVPSMSAFPEYLSKDIPIIRKQVVVGIKSQEGVYWLTTDGGERFGPFRGVVLNVAPNLASSLLLPLSVSLISMIPRSHLLSCWALMLNFEGSLPTSFDAAIIHHPNLLWAARDSSKPHRPPGERWVLQANATYSRLHQDSAQEDVGDAMLRDFFSILNIKPWDPLSMSIYKWSYPRSLAPLGENCLFDAENFLGACGAWCTTGKTEGAYDSGMAMAERILEVA